MSIRRSALDAWISEVEGRPLRTRDELDELRLTRMNELLAREAARGGYYSGLPSSIASLDELSSLPFTTADDLAENAAGMMLLSQSRVDRVISGATSGTTGPAKRIFYTARDHAHTTGFFAAGISEMQIAGEAVLIMMPFAGSGGLGDLIANAVESLGARPLRVGTSQTLDELCATAERERPTAAIAMPIPLLGLARWYESTRGEPLPVTKGLISADACTDGIVSHLAALPGMALFPHYGSREMCFGGAITCPVHEGMHLREHHIIAEIVAPDGTPLPDGEFGELVITTVDMEALPLIRYRTGDRTRFLAEPCRCGSITRRLDTVTRIAGGDISDADDVLFSVPSLIDCALTRRADGSFRLEASTLGRDGELAQLRTAFESAFPSAECEIEIRRASGGDRTMYEGKRRVLGAKKR